MSDDWNDWSGLGAKALDANWAQCHNELAGHGLKPASP